jgi:hypothetical protein
VQALSTHCCAASFATLHEVCYGMGERCHCWSVTSWVKASSLLFRFGDLFAVYGVLDMEVVEHNEHIHSRENVTMGHFRVLDRPLVGMVGFTWKCEIFSRVCFSPRVRRRTSSLAAMLGCCHGFFTSVKDAASSRNMSIRTSLH